MTKAKNKTGVSMTRFNAADYLRDTGLGRESLYKALAPGAKPRYALWVFRRDADNAFAEIFAAVETGY